MTRLSELIKASDIAKLSKRADIPAERVHALAAGADATLRELRRLAAALRVGLDELLPPTDKVEGARLLFRGAGQSSEHLAIRDRLSRKIAYSLDLLSNQRSTPWLQAFPFSDESYAAAEASAAHFRCLFYADDQVSPLFDLPRVLADSLNVALFVINTGAIDGASAYVDGVPFVFVSSRFPPRMLFTVGHELGHLIANKGRSDTFAVIDTDTDAIPGKRAHARQESFAHAFASCLLMPPRGIGIVLQKVRHLASMADGPLGDIELLYLSRIFGVSFEAAARRCEDLQLLPTGAAASLNEKLKQQFGSAEKRAAAVDLPPRPDIRFSRVPEHLLKAAVARVRTGEMSVGRAATILGISIVDLVTANAAKTH